MKKAPKIILIFLTAAVLLGAVILVFSHNKNSNAVTVSKIDAMPEKTYNHFFT